MPPINLVNKYTKKKLCLGWKPTPPERRAKIPKLSHYFKRMHGAVLPGSVDYTTKAAKSQATMLNNSQLGDCTIAAILHQMGLASANRPTPLEVIATDADAQAAYTAACGPGDQGCYIPDALDYWRDTGITAGGKLHKIAGYVAVDVNNELLVNTALYLFGGLHAGIMLPQSWYENAAPGALWDTDSSPIVGGHSIALGGYGLPNLKLTTWAMVLQVTLAALQQSRIQTELYAVIDQEWFDSTGAGDYGLNVALLQTDMATIAAGGVPDLPPDNPPNPPGPGPVPAGSQPLAATGYLGNAETGIPIILSGTVGAASHAASVGTANWLAALADIASIVRDGVGGNWAGVAADVAQLLADLGVVPTPAQLDTFHSALQDEMRNRGAKR